MMFAHIGRGGMADIYLASAATDLGGSRLAPLVSTGGFVILGLITPRE